MNMMMQSKFATYGEGVTTTRPVARYAPWVNPYHPAPNEEAYAAAWKKALAAEQRAKKQADAMHHKGKTINSRAWMDVCLAAVMAGNVTTREVADFAKCSLDHARRSLRQLEDDGDIRCEMRPIAGRGGQIANWIAIEAAE